jgi:hypothetical protein
MFSIILWTLLCMTMEFKGMVRTSLSFTTGSFGDSHAKEDVLNRHLFRDELLDEGIMWTQRQTDR